MRSILWSTIVRVSDWKSRLLSIFACQFEKNIRMFEVKTSYHVSAWIYSLVDRSKNSLVRYFDALTLLWKSFVRTFLGIISTFLQWNSLLTNLKDFIVHAWTLFRSDFRWSWGEHVSYSHSEISAWWIPHRVIWGKEVQLCRRGTKIPGNAPFNWSRIDME